MESGIGKDIALLLFGCADGLVPWFLEKGGIPVPKSLVMIGGWLTIAAIAWSSGRLLSIVEPDSFRRVTVSGLSILLLCLAVFSATWWGFRVYAPVSSVEPEPASVAAIVPTAKPNLKLSMYGANVFIPEALDVRSKLTGIALNVKVWNIGGPTVVTEWNLFITAPGTVPVVAQLTRVPAYLRLGGPVNSAVIQGSDDLEPKTAKTQIFATPIEGVLLFYVALPKAAVLDQGTRWQLTVKDIEGSETTIDKRVGDWLSR